MPNSRKRNADEKIVSDFLAELELEKSSAKGFTKLKIQFDEFYGCETIEYIDREDFPIKHKIKIIEGLNLKNNLFGTYKKIFNSLKPLIKEVNDKEQRPFKILELAGGLGDLSIGIFKEFTKSKVGLRVEITGSDIIPEYVEISASKAKAKEYPIEFKPIDALDVNKEVQEQYDIVIMLHSIHHFKPLPLFQLIRKSQVLAKYGLFAVDGRRNLSNLLFMYTTALMPTIFTLNGMYVHDALISGRRMHARSFLKRLAKKAAPDAKIVCEKLSIGLNVLKVIPSSKNQSKT